MLLHDLILKHFQRFLGGLGVKTDEIVFLLGCVRSLREIVAWLFDGCTLCTFNVILSTSTHLAVCLRTSFCSFLLLVIRVELVVLLAQRLRAQRPLQLA